MSRKRKFVNNHVILRSQIRQELKEGNNCVDIFMSICTEQKYRRIKQELVSQCFQQFEESPQFRNTMNAEQYMLFCMILDECQLKRNGLGLWFLIIDLTCKSKNTFRSSILFHQNYSWRELCILSSRLAIAPLFKNKRIVELLFFDMIYGEHM